MAVPNKYRDGSVLNSFIGDLPDGIEFGHGRAG